MTSTLIVEDGTNVSGADAYASSSFVDTYWAGRTTNALATVWAAATQTLKDSAIRIATEYLDAKYRWKGNTAYDSQSLLWPRIGVYTDRHIELTYQVPLNVQRAVAELAARALTQDLYADTDRDNWAKSQKVGPIETTYMEGAPTEPGFPFVTSLLKGLATTSSSFDLVLG